MELCPPNYAIKDSSRLCSKHFDNNAIFVTPQMRGKRLKRDAIPGSLNCSSGKHDPHIVVRCAYIVTSCNLILGVDDQLDERNIKVDEYYYAVNNKNIVLSTTDDNGCTQVSTFSLHQHSDCSATEKDVEQLLGSLQ